MGNIFTQHPFIAPTVPISDPTDGLLQASDLLKPIPVDISIWDDAQPGYSIQIKVNERLVGDSYVLTEDNHPGDVIRLLLDHNCLANDGEYRISYRATNHWNGVYDDSPQTTLKVDRSPPGAALLAPLIFPTASFGDSLIGLLPGYAGMARGDVIQTLCNDIPGPAHTVAADELTLRPIEIGFDRELLHSLATDTVLIEYIVTDRAGNGSTTSLPTLVSLQV